jgi:protein-L-isoaspartate(D-aspartate) O-methyltransferase
LLVNDDGEIVDGTNSSSRGLFDAIIVTAALGHVSPPLIKQLKVGGRLVMPLGPADAPQQLTVIEKVAPSETRMRSIILVNFVPFTRSPD